jgi:very-short-patch-repair endonuclease
VSRVSAKVRVAKVATRIPVTPFVQTLIDYSAKASLSKVRLALARADYQDGLSVSAVEAALGRGRPGAARLRLALSNHQPRLAAAKSNLEIVLFELCEANDLPLPELNARIAGWEVDALWREHRLAVEIDGPANHRSPAQIRRDRRKELALRTASLNVLRYSDEQINQHRHAVMAEVRRNLAPV